MVGVAESTKAEQAAQRKARRKARASKVDYSSARNFHVIGSRPMDASDPFLERTQRRFMQKYGYISKQVPALNSQGNKIPRKLLILGINQVHGQDRLNFVAEAYLEGVLKSRIHDEEGFTYVGYPF